MNASRDAMLALIQKNIVAHGYHLYVVSGGPLPRFAYTIGLTESLGSELTLPGGATYSTDEVQLVIAELTKSVRRTLTFDRSIELEALGSFSLRAASPAWVGELLLGATDFYRPRDVTAYQIVPDACHLTIDVPDMSTSWSIETASTWKWLRAPWPYTISAKSATVTNLEALRGAPVTEASRWEEDQWEMFAGAGPDVPPEDIRVVPLAVLLAADATLGPVVNLEVGKSLWRGDRGAQWHPWS